LNNFRDYLETKRIVESARNLTIHDVIINEARIQVSWHKLYFTNCPNLLKLTSGNSNLEMKIRGFT
jgi:hypothetical protein